MRTHGPLLVRSHESLADVLTQYLAEAGRRAWQWGEVDCFLFAADWIERGFGVDPAAEYRGAYTSAREARRIMRAAGGIVEFCNERMSRIGWVATSVPTTGAVGLVRVGFKQWHERMIMLPVAAICVRDDLWAIKPADGRQLITAKVPLIRAWMTRDG